MNRELSRLTILKTVLAFGALLPASWVLAVDFAEKLETANWEILMSLTESTGGGHLLVAVAGGSAITWTQWMTLFEDDFQDGDIANWIIPPPEPDSPDPENDGWGLVQEGGNLMLRGQGHAWANPRIFSYWTDYNTSLRVRLMEGGIHVSVRRSDLAGRYFVGFGENHICITKEAPWGTFYELGDDEISFALGQWYDVEIRLDGGTIEVMVDEVPVLSAVDDEPLTAGDIAVETLGNADEGWSSEAYVDDFHVEGDRYCYEMGWIAVKTTPNGEVEWTKLYEISEFWSWEHSVLARADGGYYIAATLDPSCSDDSDAFLVSLDPQGNPEWARKIGAEGIREWSTSLASTSDGGVIVCIRGGWLTDWPVSGPSYSVGGEDILLIRFNAQGNVVWQKAFGGEGHDVANVAGLSDGNYLVSGGTLSFGFGGYDFVALKIDPDGNVLWQALLGGARHDDGGVAIETADGGIIHAGSTESTGPGPDPDTFHRDILLAKLDSDGGLVWQRAFGSSDFYEGRIYDAPARTEGGDFVFSGTRAGVERETWFDEPFWFRVSDAGELVWAKTMRPPVTHDELMPVAGVAKNQDGLIACGTLYVEDEQDNSFDYDLMLIGMDETFEPLHCPLFDPLELPEVFVDFETDVPEFTVYDPNLAVTSIGDDVEVSAITIDVEPLDCRSLGDCDADGDVDLGDFSAFLECFTGPGEQLDPGCEFADFDGDGDVDLGDFLAFQVAYTGPGG